MKEVLFQKYDANYNQERLWQKITSLGQETVGAYQVSKGQFVKIWSKWEAKLVQGEKALDLLKREKFCVGLSPLL